MAEPEDLRRGSAIFTAPMPEPEAVPLNKLKVKNSHLYSTELGSDYENDFIIGLGSDLDCWSPTMSSYSGDFG
jgi:hypothetical protein